MTTRFRNEREVWKSENGMIPLRTKNDALACQRRILGNITMALFIVTLHCALSCRTFITGARAFSAAAKPNARSNKHEYNPSSILEVQLKFDAWKASNQKIDTLLEFTVGQEDLDYSSSSSQRGSRVSHFASRVFSDSLPTPNAANLACRRGSLTVNATKVSGGRILREGDILLYRNGQVDRRTAVPSDPDRAERFCASRLRLLQTLQDEDLTHSPLRVLYQDRCMAIVCKPAGIHTMSWSGSFGKSLCLDEILPLVLNPPGESSSLSSSDGETEDGLEEDEGLPAPLPRHRLDHRVAGPVVVAKTRRACVEIGRSFEEKRVTKEYRAIVVGEIDVGALVSLEGISNITTTASSTSSIQSFVITSDVDGKASETYVEVLGSTPCNVNGVLTDLKLFPRTGRKHQLRIHCARVLGTPILGDDLYWDEKRLGLSVRKRQGLYLYCKSISIDHPLLGRKKRVAAEMEEPLRFTRTRTKARKGYEWRRIHEQSEYGKRNNLNG